MNSKTIIAICMVIGLVILLFIFNPNKVENERRDEEVQNMTVSKSKLNLEAEKETLTSKLDELQIETLSVGEGEETQLGDRIRVHYIGWLAETGEVFDSSLTNGLDNGFAFAIGSGVIQGWSDGTIGMQVGEVRRLKIPSELGYGEFGAGESIPPSADLIFDVELLEIL